MYLTDTVFGFWLGLMETESKKHGSSMSGSSLGLVIPIAAEA
jgi:hypothetical protein